MDESYDVVIVGARVAGAATAMLLARSGLRVLVLDRARRGSDTCSTHALMRPAVTQLERWGLLGDLVAAGTPAVERVRFHYGDDVVDVEPRGRLYAPRRTVLDPLLVAAAERAGATVRFGEDVRAVTWADGRVTGVTARTLDGSSRTVRARLVVGADGRRSRVARAVGAPTTRAHAAAGAVLYGYWTGVAAAGYEWCYRPGSSAGLVPTDGDRTCVFVEVPASRARDLLRGDRDATFASVLAATTPEVAHRVAAGRRDGPLRGFPGAPGWLRRPWGPGWALVGDAGYHRDPGTAHGISDALRDAELLAAAAHRALTGVEAADSALARYEDLRDELALPLLEVTAALASYTWDVGEVQHLHRAMTSAMQREVEVLAALAPTDTCAA